MCLALKYVYENTMSLLLSRVYFIKKTMTLKCVLFLFIIVIIFNPNDYKDNETVQLP